MHALRWLWSATLVAGCGRVGFEAGRDASANDDADDAAIEARICDRYPQALYCNDFEDGLSGLDFSDGTIASTIGYGGSAGMTFTAAPGVMPRASRTLVVPIQSAPFYIAGRMLLAPGAPIEDYVVVAQTISNAGTKVSFDLVSLDSVQLVNSVNMGGARRAVAQTFPRGRWFCYEMMIDVGVASAGGVTLAIDAQEMLSGWQGSSTLPTGGWVRVEIGAFASPANVATATVIFDNWVVQAAPIGCP
ncbi:MAG: hypothetical protein ACKV2T_34200 [Kofleriaceae bacterium]